MTEFTYKVGPLVFSSNVELPYAMAPAHMRMATISVVEQLPESPAPQGEHVHEIVNAQGIWIFSGGVARALVRSGEQAFVLKSGTVRSPQIVVTAALRVMLALSGVVLIHASAVAQVDGAWVWVGESGSGKSTTAAREALGGALHLNDDIVPLCFNSEGRVCTFQCDRFASLVLQEDGSVNGLARERLLHGEVFGQRCDGKMFYQVSSASSELYPVVSLRHLTAPGQSSRSRVSDSECVHVLLKSIVGYGLIPAAPRRHLALVAALVQQLELAEYRAGVTSPASQTVVAKSHYRC